MAGDKSVEDQLIEAHATIARERGGPKAVDGHDSFDAAANRLTALLKDKRLESSGNSVKPRLPDFYARAAERAAPADSESSTAVECVRLGIRRERIVLSIESAGVELSLSPDEADQLSADLRQFSLELRNGGRFE